MTEPKKLAAVSLPEGGICKGLPLSNPPLTAFDNYRTVNLTFEGWITWITAAIEQRLALGKNVTILCDGMPRQGKSTILMHLVKSQGLGLDCVAFTMDEFKERTRKTEYGGPGNWQLCAYDEAGVGLYSKDWQTNFSKEMNKWFQISGIKKNITWFNLPKYKILNKETFTNFVWMRIWVPMTGYAEVSLVRPQKWEENWFKPALGFSYPKLEGKLWDAYEKKKMAFLEKPDIEKKQESDGRKSYKEDFENLMIADYKDGLRTQAQIAKIIKKTQQAVSERIRTIVSNKNQEGDNTP